MVVEPSKARPVFEDCSRKGSRRRTSRVTR